MSVYNEKHKEYTKKYAAEKYDQTLIRLPKGKLAVVKEFAAAQGKSFNSFINDCIDEAMKEKI